MEWKMLSWFRHPSASSFRRHSNAKEFLQGGFFADLLELKNVTARRRSWRAKEYNSLTQGRPMSPETQRYYDEQFGQGTMDYPGAQLYANGGNWQQDAFNGYTIDGLEPSQGHL
jgi:hypothetical protein